ncbi:MAG: hypothetical protein V4760_00840 [Bdellovibrionota bacterium]
MRHNLRRVTQVLLFLFLGSVVAVGFQNCGTYEPIENPLYTNDQGSVCIGLGCAMDREMIELVSGSGNVIGIPKPATAPANCDNNVSKCFDLGGFCESGGYPDTQISLQLDGPTPVAEYPTSAKCDAMGRFALRVELPANYDYNQTYQLRVTLRGVETNGTFVDNPRTINQTLITLIPVL